MNKMMKYALGAVITAGLAVPAMAQDQFPDVPDNHWAYEALRTLKDKVLVGYPDGLYRGNRPMSRYEYAAATARLYNMIMGKTNDLQDQIDALKNMVESHSHGNTGGGGVSQADFDALKRQVAELERMMASKADKSDLDSLRRLINEFERELASLGVDVDAMKKDIADLDSRVRALEERKPAIDISGDANLLILAGNSNDNEYGLMTNSRITGYGRGGYNAAPVGMSRDLNVLHELAVNLETTNEEGPTAKGTLVFGNVNDMLWDNSNGYNGTMFGSPYTEAEADIFIDHLAVNFGSSFAGQAFEAELGRVKHKVGPYLFARNDYTPEYHNERYDNGMHTFDGGILSFMFGGASLNVFGGRNEDVESLDDTEINGLNVFPGFAGRVDQSLGADLNIPIGDKGDITLAYIFQDSNTRQALGAGFVNRLVTYGADANFQFGNVKFMGSYAMTSLNENDSVTFDDDTTAWSAGLGYDGGNWGVQGAYRRVDPNFTANGAWGRLGTRYNPGNIEGFNGKLWFAPNDQLKLWAKGEFVEGAENFFGANGVFGSENDDATSIRVGLDYYLNDNFGLMLGFENVDWSISGTDFEERWYNLGFHYMMNDSSKLLINYAYSDIDYNGFNFNPAQGFTGRNVFKGGLLSTQLSVKF